MASERWACFHAGHSSIPVALASFSLTFSFILLVLAFLGCFILAAAALQLPVDIVSVFCCRVKTDERNLLSDEMKQIYDIYHFLSSLDFQNKRQISSYCSF